MMCCENISPQTIYATIVFAAIGYRRANVKPKIVPQQNSCYAIIDIG